MLQIRKLNVSFVEKKKGEHQAKTMNCPMGIKYKMVGWIAFSRTQIFSI